MSNDAVDYKRKWLVLASVAMGIFLATIDGSIVNIALPSLVAELKTDFATVQWVVLAYLLVNVTLMLGVGRLADMIGKKYLYSIGFIVFTIGSVLCGLSSTVYMLIACRVFQALGAVLMAALGTAIVTEAFPPEERGKALGINGLMVSLGIISGPTLGGLILGAFTWHWIFFVNLPIGIGGIFMVTRFVPNLRPAGGQRFDYLGAITLFIGLLMLLTGLTIGQNSSFSDLRVLGLFAGCLIFLASFVIIELRISQPMIDLRLFQNALFSVNLVTGFLTFVAGAGSALLMPFFLEGVLAFDPTKAGLIMAVTPLATGIVAPLAGVLSDRFGSRPLTVVGLGILFCGYIAVSTLDQNVTPLGYILRFLPVGVGIGFFQSPNNSAIMGAVPRARLGVASGLLAITRTLGQTTGIAVIGALWASQVSQRAGGISISMSLETTTSTVATINAPVTAQVGGLHITLLVLVGLMAFALLASIWAFLTERVKRQVKANVPIN
jgi:EmrB/QacA subfamily drug resistance transporter